MKPMRVLVADGDHHDYTLGRMCARAFAELGHNVRYFGTNTQTVPVVGWSIGERRMRDSFVEAVKTQTPDVVFIIKGDQFTGADIRRAQRESEAVFCNWNPDNPFMTRSQERHLENFLASLREYDLLFTCADEITADLTDRTETRVRTLPFGHDPTVHYPAPVCPEFEADVAFAGHTSAKRKKYLRALARLDIDLAIYGDYWQTRCFDRAIRPHVRDGTIYGEPYCSAFCSAKIVLNVVADHNLDAYNMRSFEVPATRSFMLSTRTAGQREFLSEDDQAAYFDDTDELIETVKYYLENDDEREAIATAGRKAIADHSYVDRMETVMAEIQAVKSKT